MIDITQAVEVSRQLLPKVMPDFAALDPDVEEFALSTQGDRWIITFRAKNPHQTDVVRGVGAFFAPFIDKVVSVSAEDGALLSIRNPSLEY